MSQSLWNDACACVPYQAPLLRPPAIPQDLEPGQTWWREDVEVVAWVAKAYATSSLAWHEQAQDELYAESAYFGPCRLDGYSPDAPKFYAETAWLYPDGSIIHVIGTFDARSGCLIELPATTAHKLWMRRYPGDPRSQSLIREVDRARCAHYFIYKQWTPTMLHELPGQPLRRWYMPTQGGRKTWPWY